MSTIVPTLHLAISTIHAHGVTSLNRGFDGLVKTIDMGTPRLRVSSASIARPLRLYVQERILDDGERPQRTRSLDRIGEIVAEALAASPDIIAGVAGVPAGIGRDANGKPNAVARRFAIPCTAAVALGIAKVKVTEDHIAAADVASSGMQLAAMTFIPGSFHVNLRQALTDPKSGLLDLAATHGVAILTAFTSGPSADDIARHAKDIEEIKDKIAGLEAQIAAIGDAKPKGAAKKLAGQLEKERNKLEKKEKEAPTVDRKMPKPEKGSTLAKAASKLAASVADLFTASADADIVIALFGAMYASNPGANVDRMLSIAHSVSTSTVNRTSDDFVAVDDVLDGSHDGEDGGGDDGGDDDEDDEAEDGESEAQVSGTGHMGSGSCAAAVLVGSMCLSIPASAVKTFGLKRLIAAVEAVMDGVLTTVPNGKQGPNLSRPMAAYMRVDALLTPISHLRAFYRPIEDRHPAGIEAASVLRLSRDANGCVAALGRQAIGTAEYVLPTVIDDLTDAAAKVGTGRPGMLDKQRDAALLAAKASGSDLTAAVTAMIRAHFAGKPE